MARGRLEDHAGALPARRAAERLAADLEARGYGSKGQAYEAIGKRAGSGYLTNQLAKPHGGSRLPLESYVGLAVGAGMSPDRVLARGLASKPVHAYIADAEQLASRAEAVPALLRRAPVHGRSKLDRGLEDGLVRELDALRYVNSRRASERAASCLREARGPRAVARLLGVWCSAQRMASRLDLASIGLGRALALADVFELDDVVAELARRTAVVLRDRGEIEWGLALVRGAAAYYFETGAWEELGRAFVDCGSLHSRRGEIAVSKNLAHAALRFTSSDRHRCAAYHQIAHAEAILGNKKAADLAAERAASCAPPGRHLTGRLAWLRGRIAAERGDLVSCTRFLTRALDELRTSAVDAVMVGTELACAKLRLGNFTEAKALIITLQHFVGPLRGDPLDIDHVMAEALEELVAAGGQASLTEALIAAIIDRFEFGRQARRKRLQQRLRP